MIIAKKWAMSSVDTLTIKPIFELFKKYHRRKDVVVDPFARNCKLGTITNDLNPDCNTTYHLDALQFLKMLKSEMYDFVIYDPPFSYRQASEAYKSFGKEWMTYSVTNARYWSKIKNEVARILKPNGICMCCGWNTNGLGKSRGFRMDEILICSHGAGKNDTLVTIEHKIPTIFDYAD